MTAPEFGLNGNSGSLLVFSETINGPGHIKGTISATDFSRLVSVSCPVTEQQLLDLRDYLNEKFPPSVTKA